MAAADTDMRFFFSNGTRRRAPSSGCCREIATIRSAVLGGILETDFFDLRFEAILLKSRPIGIEQQLGFALAWHVLRNPVTVFLMSVYKMILYHQMKWCKRLVNKKMRPLPAHGAKGHLMTPEGQFMTKKDHSCQISDLLL
jgi:hypothetical protein